ncbi:hypothetical protein NIES4071_08360 [Calothrix sp. NIES-4071]|nr:hypothetical protein NIES4071_08360 [Calothrix sp. NIES-4071]BAZ55178.1 hypothetical protein NIES4105_08320 [Calothrix sp. NIES-4105]
MDFFGVICHVNLREAPQINSSLSLDANESYNILNLISYLDLIISSTLSMNK